MAQAYIVLTLTVEQEDDQFVGICPELGTASCGDTIEEAFSNLEEAIEVHLEALRDIGSLDRVFRERAIEVYRGRPADSAHPPATPGALVRATSRRIPIPA